MSTPQARNSSIGRRTMWAGCSLLAILFLMFAAVPYVLAEDQGADSHSLTSVLLRNGSFEEWAQGVPRFWSLRDGSGTLGLSDAKHRGKPVLQLSTPNAVLQQVADPPLIQGDIVFWTFYLRVSEPDTVFADIELHYEDGQRESIRVRKHHPGDGEWHLMRLGCQVPTNRPKFMRFAIHVRPEARQPVFISDAHADIVSAVP